MWIMRHTLGSNKHKTILVNGYYSSPVSNGGIIGKNWPIYPPRWANVHARPNSSTPPWLVLTCKTKYRGKKTLSYSAGAGTLLTLAFRAAQFPLISPLRPFPSKQQWSRMMFFMVYKLLYWDAATCEIIWPSKSNLLNYYDPLTFSRATHSCRLHGSVSFQAQWTGGCSGGLFGWKIRAMWKL